MYLHISQDSRSGNTHPPLTLESRPSSVLLKKMFFYVPLSSVVPPDLKYTHSIAVAKDSQRVSLFGVYTFVPRVVLSLIIVRDGTILLISVDRQ